MKSWSLFAYDIRDKKRLQRVRRCLESEAMYCQNSVYLAYLSPASKQALMEKIHTYLKPEDDLRTYPVRNPKDVWQWGKSHTLHHNESGFFKRLIQF